MYIILGCLIDGISMIVLTAVIVLPMVKEAGFDLVWFGVYLVIHVEMAQITPPVGFNLFVLQNMSGKDTWTIAKAAFPFFILLNVAVHDHHDLPADRALLAQARLPGLSSRPSKRERDNACSTADIAIAAFALRRAARSRFAAPASAQTKWNLPAAYPADNPHSAKTSCCSPRTSRPRPAASCRSPSIRVPALFKAPEIKRAVAAARRRWARC
jgi:hypothetical protein